MVIFTFYVVHATIFKSKLHCMFLTSWVKLVNELDSWACICTHIYMPRSCDGRKRFMARKLLYVRGGMLHSNVYEANVLAVSCLLRSVSLLSLQVDLLSINQKANLNFSPWV